MEVMISIAEIPLCEGQYVIRWDIHTPDEDDLKFGVEINKEMDLNIMAQFYPDSKGAKLW
jgi:hypothetical protein